MAKLLPFGLFTFFMPKLIFIFMGYSESMLESAWGLGMLTAYGIVWAFRSEIKHDISNRPAKLCTGELGGHAVHDNM